MLNTTAGNVYTRKQIFVSLFIILLCCVIAYWPVSTGIFSLKNDAVRYFLPVRYQISEMIQHGQFPFWTPYINLGHPLYTDMQSGVWNPMVWLISMFGSYNMRCLQVELLIYIYLSGVSMFFLLKYFKLNWFVSLALAISFMLCGFISDSTQFLYWICGMAFLPFVFLFFLKTLREASFHSTLLLAFSLYLLFVTGYPGEFIIIIYFLLTYFIIHIIQNKKDAVKVFKQMLLAALIFGLFSLPAIISYLSGLDYITRGAAVSLDLALTNSMHPFNFISYIFPLTVWKLPITETDILGKNSFLGLLPFLLILISLFTKTKNSFLVFLKWVFILSLILSLGKYGILRSIIYYILPYMDTFRHPSMFRFLSIFSGCILAAFTLNELLKNQESFILKKKAFTVVSILMILISLLVLVFSSSGFSDLLPASISTISIKSWFDNSTINNWLILELMIQIPFMFLIYRYFVRKINLKVIMAATVINSVIHTILLQPVTVVGTETVSSFQSKINSIKRDGFPIPNLNSTILSNSLMSDIAVPKYGPQNMYSKNLGYQFDFITPGPLISHEKFIDKENLHKAVFNFPVLYRADTALLYSDSSELPINKKFVLTDDQSLITYINRKTTDTFFTPRMLKFNPNKWEFEVSNSVPGFFCLVQNYYPNWTLTVNGKKETVYICNQSLIGFKLSPGKNHVKLEFKDDKVLNAFYLHLILWALFIVYFSIFLLKRNKN